MAQTALSGPDGEPLAEIVAPPRPASRRLAFAVAGVPQTQGSKKGIVVGKRAIVIDDNKDLLYPWRDKVGEHARRALPADWEIIDGPVFAALTFYRHRGDDHYLVDGVTLGATGKRRPYPETRPDTGKMARAVHDAMQGIVYTEDSRITDDLAVKRWTERSHGEPSAGLEAVPGLSGVVRGLEGVTVEIVAL
jgi:Holliday junction resolvase RusA-like endonuclease